jgi:hypothetical protein
MRRTLAPTAAARGRNPARWSTATSAGGQANNASRTAVARHDARFAPAIEAEVHAAA